LGAEFSPNGKLLAIAERGHEETQNRINIYATENWERIRSWQAHKLLIHCLAFSPDSKRLATCADDHHCKVWNLESPDELPEYTKYDHNIPILGVGFLLDGSHVGIMTHDEQLISWNYRTKEVNRALRANYGWNGAIAAGGMVTITINATVDSSASGTIVNQGTINFDSDGSGTNDSSALTDNPAGPGPADPTGFAIARAIPTLGPAGLLLLAFGLVAIWYRRERIIRK
jgi:WD40 repeat protein